MNSQLRILNEKGIAFYRDYLDELRSGSERKPPQELLVDPWCSARVPLEVSIEAKTFQNKLAIGKYLNDVLRLSATLPDRAAGGPLELADLVLFRLRMSRE